MDIFSRLKNYQYLIDRLRNIKDGYVVEVTCGLQSKLLFQTIAKEANCTPNGEFTREKVRIKMVPFNKKEEFNIIKI